MEKETTLGPPAPPPLAPQQNAQAQVADLLARKIMEIIAIAYDVAVEIASTDDENVKKTTLYKRAKELVAKLRELRDLQQIVQASAGAPAKP